MKSLSAIFHRQRIAVFAVAFLSMAFTACTTTGPHNQATPAQQRSSINERADASLNTLYKAVPAARGLIKDSKAILIFPEVLSAGFVLGVQHGDGVLRVNGKNEGYYSATGGSIGWQIGAQSRAVFLVFKTQAALDKFRQSNGWTVGADATVALAKVGANGAIDSNTAQDDVVGFVLTNGGLMAGISLEGTKIHKKTFE